MRVPDLAIFELSTIIEQDGFIHSPPQLVAEVLAPGEDLSRKLADYASLGVPEVWVISPESRTVEFLVFENGGLHSRQALSDGTFTSPNHPHVTVNVSDLWSDWPPQRVEWEQMATMPNSNTVSYEEWLRMPEVSDAIEEVVNGEIRLIPAPKWDRGEIVENLHYELTAQLDRRAIRVRAAEFGLIIRKSPLTSRIPDLAVFERSTMIEQDGYIHSAPQLAVEVLSPANTRREREEKLNDYAAIGVPEVWVVSPEALTVEVLYLEDNCLRRSHVIADGTLTPKLFPHVKIEIAKIWPD